MRVLIRSNSIGEIMRWGQRSLFAGAFLLLGYCVYTMAASWAFQRRATVDLERATLRPARTAVSVSIDSQPQPDAPIGRMEVARLGVSVVIVEGTGALELEHGAGHIEGTVLPGQVGNTGIAAHRDTFFRPLRNIRTGDLIEIKTTKELYRYRVISTRIVNPDNVSVLASDGSEILTLVTCYPFYYIGPAPRRFIVRAERLPEEVAALPVPTLVIAGIEKTN